MLGIAGCLLMCLLCDSACSNLLPFAVSFVPYLRKVRAGPHKHSCNEGDSKTHSERSLPTAAGNTTVQLQFWHKIGQSLLLSVLLACTKPVLLHCHCYFRLCWSWQGELGMPTCAAKHLQMPNRHCQHSSIKHSLSLQPCSRTWAMLNCSASLLQKLQEFSAKKG